MLLIDCVKTFRRVTECSCCSRTHLSTQGRSVRSKSTSARATPVTTEALASTNQTASPVTVHPGGWDPAVKSVSHPVRKLLFGI